MDIAKTEKEISELEERLQEIEGELEDKQSFLEDLRVALSDIIHGPPVEKGVYKLYFDCGRQGSVEGVFISTPEEIKSAIGKTVYFGEVLGKHSEISGTLEEKDIQLVTQDPKAIQVIEDCNLTTGFNPLDYLEE